MARWRKAWGECALSGRRMLTKDMVLDGQFNIWVDPAEYQIRHPQEYPINTTEVYPPNKAPQVSIPFQEGAAAPVPVFDENGTVTFISPGPFYLGINFFLGQSTIS